MILLRDLKAAMRVDSSKDMSVHVLTYISYNFKRINTSCMGSCGADKTCVFLRLAVKMSVRFYSKKSTLIFVGN
jgi:hypothetical protein